MDIFAYAQIGDLEQLAESNGISVPRLRGYRLMRDERPIDPDGLLNGAVKCAVTHAVGGGFLMNSGFRAGADRASHRSRQDASSTTFFMTPRPTGYVSSAIRWISSPPSTRNA